MHCNINSQKPLARLTDLLPVFLFFSSKLKVQLLKSLERDGISQYLMDTTISSYCLPKFYRSSQNIPGDKEASQVRFYRSTKGNSRVLHGSLFSVPKILLHKIHEVL